MFTGLSSFATGYSAGYQTASKDNAVGGKSYQSAYRTGMQAGMLSVQRKLKFLDSMRCVVDHSHEASVLACVSQEVGIWLHWGMCGELSVCFETVGML
jgi:hypothetical protein